MHVISTATSVYYLSAYWLDSSQGTVGDMIFVTPWFEKHDEDISTLITKFQYHIPHHTSDNPQNALAEPRHYNCHSDTYCNISR